MSSAATMGGPNSGPRRGERRARGPGNLGHGVWRHYLIKWDHVSPRRDQEIVQHLLAIGVVSQTGRGVPGLFVERRLTCRLERRALERRLGKYVGAGIDVTQLGETRTTPN